MTSYSHKDRALRDELAAHLSNLRKQGQISDWYDGDIVPGSELKTQILAHLNKAHLILLLISADFMASEFCYSIEMQQAIARHQANQARIIPVILRPTDWEGAPFSDLKALPTDGKAVTGWPTHDDAFADVMKGLRAAIKDLNAGTSSNPEPRPSNSSTTSMGTRQVQIWTLPFRRNPFFTGREDLLSRLHEQLTHAQTAALTQAQAINGLGGVGKTQTAVEYAHRYRDQYQAVLWAGAETRISLLADFGKLAAALQLPEHEAQDQEVLVAAVKRWLLAHANWLLILDNADDLQLAADFLPLGAKGHMLLTTRAQALGTLARSLPVEEMGSQEGTLLLLRRARVLDTNVPLESAAPSERATAEAIVQAVGGLPLALDQAGAYIEETGCALTDYLHLYQARRRDLLGLRKSLMAEHPQPVTTTWSLSFQKLDEANPAATALLRLCAFLAPDGIAEEILTEGAPHLGNVLKPVAADALRLNQAIEEARRYSLLKRQPATKTLSIHRLVQAVLHDQMTRKEQHQWAERAIRALNQVFPVVELETWAQCARYLPHVQVCAELMEQYQLAFPEAARLLHQTAYYLLDHARYTEAERYYQQAMRIKQQVLPAEHRETAATLHQLGVVKWDQGRYEEAEQYLQQALHMEQQVLPAEHPDTATTLQVLGTVKLDQSRYEEAEQYLQQALRIYQQVLPAEHPSTAATLHVLGLVKRRQARYEEAEQYYQQALHIKQKMLPAEHPSTIITLESYASLLRKMGRANEASILEARLKTR